MTCFTANSNRGKLIGIGLSDENLRRLEAGQPISFPLSQLNLPWEAHVMIFHGTTEESMAEMLERGGLVDVKTRVVLPPEPERH